MAEIAISQTQFTEKEYTLHIQSLIGGETEISVESGRGDLLTKTHAFEVERASKWKESIGQALWYGLQTNKKPGIIILMTTSSDYKYFIQLSSSLKYAKLDEAIDVYLYPTDFQELIEKQ